MVSETLLLPWYQYPPFSESGIGGLSVAVLETARALARKGVDVDVLVPLEQGRRSELEDYVNVTTSRLGSKLCAGQRLNSAETTSITRNHDRVLSISNYGAASLHSSKEVLRIVRRQVHVVAHDRPLSSYVSLKPSPASYARMIIQRMREKTRETKLAGVGSMCVSRFVADGAIRHGVEKAEKAVVIPNGVDTSRFRPLRVDKEFDLLFVGRFQMAKGLDILLEALQMAEEASGKRASLGIVGPFTGRERSLLYSTVPTRIRESIRFLGVVTRDDMPRMISSARFLVNPSRYETFGLPVLEAIACGVPVISSNVGGLPELVDERIGVLVDPNSKSLAKAIQCVMLGTTQGTASPIGPEIAHQYAWDLISEKQHDFVFS